MENKIRILLHTNHPLCMSGYGIQADMFAERIHAHDKAEMAFSSNFGLQGTILRDYKGMDIYPSLFVNAGDMTLLPAHAAAFHADVVMTLYDLTSVSPIALKGLKWVPFVPVDVDRIPLWMQDKLRYAWRIIAYSMHSYNLMHDLGIDAKYIPHAYDPKHYYVDSAESKKYFDNNPDSAIPENTFLYGFVGMNKGQPSRKGIEQLLQAWATIQKEVPNSMLYMHMPKENIYDGVDVGELMRELHVDQERVLMPKTYPLVTGNLGFDYMRKFYNRMNVMVMPTHGEGFCLPVCESQACGTPVITTAFGPMIELNMNGWQVKWEPYWVGGQRAFRAWPSIESLREQMWNAYAEWRDDRGAYDERCKQCVRFAKSYDINLVYKTFMEPFIDEMEHDIHSTAGIPGM